MNTLVLATLFFTALGMSYFKGIRWAFPFALLPGLLLFFQTVGVAIPMIPDVNAVSAVTYGALVGFVIKGGEPLNMRWCGVDTAVVALALVYIASSFAHYDTWEAVSAGGSRVLLYLGPYFLGRVALPDIEVRRASLWVLCIISVILVPPTLVEWRLSPYFLSRILEHNFGLIEAHNTQTYHRFGFYRTIATFAHPIDNGNVMTMVAGLIAALAYSVGLKLTNPKVLVGLAAASIVALTAMSFTSFMVIAIALTMVVTIRFMPWVGHAAWLPVAIGVLGFALLTSVLLGLDLERPDFTGTEANFNGSLYMRMLIVQTVFDEAIGSGPLGAGENFQFEELFMNSIDNAYLLMLLEQGWIYLLLFLALPFLLAGEVGKALRMLPNTDTRMPLIVNFSVLVAVMAGMYTVWFGFAYEPVWVVMLGLTVSMAHFVRDRATATAPQSYPVGMQPAMA
ncbi:MAG: hypothetical protein AAGD32_14515 [Planctomycetota bacterium]